MDPLAHVFLPLTAAVALRPDLFESRWTLAIGLFGLLPDLGKYAGLAGLSQSMLLLAPVGIGLAAGEWLLARQVRWAVLANAFTASHLVLDVLDGGPVSLLAPVVDAGFGLRFPARILFGEGPLGVVVHGPLVTVATAVPKSGFQGYGLFDGFGVASVLLFVVVYGGLYWRPQPARNAR